MSQKMSVSAEFQVFTKEVGFHRGNPRLYFQTTALNRFGFTPGAAYNLEFKSPEEVAAEGVILTLELKPEGKRKVCKKAVGSTVYSIIDINVKAPTLSGGETVSVSVTQGKMVVVKLVKAA